LIVHECRAKNIDIFKMKNQISFENVRLKKNLICLSATGFTVFEQGRTLTYVFKEFVPWVDLNPFEMLSKYLLSSATNPLIDEVDFFLDNSLTDISVEDAYFGSGWHVDEEALTLSLLISSIFGKGTYKLELETEFYQSIVKIFDGINFRDSKLFLKIPDADFRYFVYFKLPMSVGAGFGGLNVSTASNFPKLNAATTTKVVAEPKLEKPLIHQDKAVTDRHSEIDGFQGQSVVFLLDETRETSLLTAKHFKEAHHAAIFVELGSWFSSIPTHLEKYLFISEKIKLESDAITGDAVAGALADISAKYPKNDIVIIIQKRLSSLINISEMPSQILSSNKDVKIILSCHNPRQSDFSNTGSDFSRFQLISGDTGINQDILFSEKFTYKLNLQVISEFLKLEKRSATREELGAALSIIKSF